MPSRRCCCKCCVPTLVAFVGVYLAVDDSSDQPLNPTTLPTYNAVRLFYDEALAREAIAAHATRAPNYFYPSGRGTHDSYGVSPFAVPINLSATPPSWYWPPKEEQYSTMPWGVTIDDKKNLYLSAVDGLRKFSPDGTMLWSHREPGFNPMNNAGLYQGAIYITDNAGHIRAVAMETGELLWKTKVCNYIGGNNGFTMAQAGVVISQADALPFKDPNYHVRGLNATDGTPLWTFKPDQPVWNFMASFVGDGTFVFMDVNGRAYRCRLSDGTLIWKSGGQPGTWTDATATLGPNGVMYTQSTPLPMGMDGAKPLSSFLYIVLGLPIMARKKNLLSAYAVEDGALLWQTEVPRMATNAVAVGRLHGAEGLSVVQPAGMQTVIGQQTDVYAYDAASGRHQWTFYGPKQKDHLQQGDLQGLERRKREFPQRPLCLPNPWSSPTIDAAGAVYVGNQDGIFVGLRDLNGDGQVFGPEEVHVYDTVGTFAGSSSPAMAPGLLAAANCDTLYVWRFPPAAAG